MIDMTENDFGVLMRPVESDRDDADTHSSLEVSVFSNHMPDVDDETHAHLMFLAYKMAAMAQFCEDNPDFDEALSEYTEDLLSDLGITARGEEDTPSPSANIVGREGNVITLDFNTKCRGNG